MILTLVDLGSKTYTKTWARVKFTRIIEMALGLPGGLPEASNQNRYCSGHQYLPAEPLSSFLSGMVWPPEGAKVA